MHVWDEDTDTWSVDGSPSTKYAVYYLGSYNGVIYAVYHSTKVVYKYEDGAFVECNDFADTKPSNYSLLHHAYLYDDTGIYMANMTQTAGNLVQLYKINFATGEWEFIDTLPARFEMYPQFAFFNGDLIYLLGIASTGYSPLIRRVVSE
jgi:hypothetical protein